MSRCTQPGSQAPGPVLGVNLIEHVEQVGGFLVGRIESDQVNVVLAGQLDQLVHAFTVRLPRPAGALADLLDPRSYPVVAECLECGRTVRCEAYFFSDWEHLDDPQT